jgi:hypothetical protein
MKVKTQLTQLRLNYGNISDQEISENTLNQARELIKQGFARADSMTPPPAEEIWNCFEATIQRIGTQLQKSESPFC